MSIIEQGGILMWPLAGLSVLALGIILDRGIVFSTLSFPGRKLAATLAGAVREGRPDLLQEACADFPTNLAAFRDVLLRHNYSGDREKALRILGDGFVRMLDRRLGLLGVIVRVAPLVGLLGTVLGMISSFSNIANASGGVDMTGLAGGIWQALLTTAAGLGIAIPALLAHHYFIQRQEAVAETLENLIDAALALENMESSIDLTAQNQSEQLKTKAVMTNTPGAVR